MAESDKIYRVDRKPVNIPSGCVAAWQWNASPPKIWYDNDGTITEWTGGGVTNPMTSNLAAGNNKITGLATPTSNYDAATKKYVDDAIIGSNVDFIVGTFDSSAYWSAQPITYFLDGELVLLSQNLTNSTGYTGNTVVDIDPIPAARRPSGAVIKPISYYDDSAGTYHIATIKINTDGTIQYYPPSGVTPAVDDILYINIFYRS